MVRDLDVMLAFYRDHLGLSVQTRSEESGPFLDALLGLSGALVTTVKVAGSDGGPVLVELLHFVHPVSPDRPPLAVNTPGPTHVAFTVSDLRGLHARMVEAGVSFLHPPRESRDGRALVTYGRDPEGNFVELVEMLPESGG